MIIRATLKSNIYTQIIEKYFDDGGPFVQTYYNSKHEFEKFKKDVKKLYNYNFGCSEKEMFKPFLATTIYKNFINYINTIEENSNWKTERFSAEEFIRNKKFILKNIDIKLVNLIVDTSFNKEVVFYIHQINKYITL